MNSESIPGEIISVILSLSSGIGSTYSFDVKVR